MSNPYVGFDMYPFPSFAWAWDELWAAVHERTPWTPERLTHSSDPHADWQDDDCIVTQVCAWPFATRHREEMNVIGAFELDLADAEPGGHYRAVLLSPHDHDLTIGPDTHAVANSVDSLSGWVSLLAATLGPGAVWPGSVTLTSAHYDSVRALAKGEADLGSIDSWSVSFIEAEAPDLLAGLRRVGVGPAVPTPAIAARGSLELGLVDELRDAFAEAIADPATATARDALHIDGFVRLTLDDYLAVLPLGPAA